jgi:hypothetical protein
MDVKRLIFEAGTVISSAVHELDRKAPDYAPDGVVFVDLIQQCAEADIDQPRKLLWALASKHLTAVRTYARTGRLSSETLRGRVIDGINFLAMMDVWAAHESEILSSVYNHFADSACECRGASRVYLTTGDVCPRCQVMAWYHDTLIPSRTDLILKLGSSRSTPKPLD